MRKLIRKMKFSREPKILAPILLITTGIFLLIVTTVHAMYYAPEKQLPPETLSSLGIYASSTPISSEVDYPSKLIIPAISVDANIENTGISFKGNMSVPSSYFDVGWYRYGTVPGKKGSAVIAGHVDDGFSLDGVFKHLKDLKIGDDVYVHTVGGQRLHFVVLNVESYPLDSAPLQKIFNENDDIYLNLITCDGVWIPEKGTNANRLVVYTKRVE